MRAMVAENWGEPSGLKLVELPDPVPSAGQVSIEIHAIGCNFFDVLMLQGKYQIKPPLPFSPGSEISGLIREVGAGVENLHSGDRVFAMMPWGAYANIAVAPAASVFRMP